MWNYLPEDILRHSIAFTECVDDAMHLLQTNKWFLREVPMSRRLWGRKCCGSFHALCYVEENDPAVDWYLLYWKYTKSYPVMMSSEINLVNYVSVLVSTSSLLDSYYMHVLVFASSDNLILEWSARVVDAFTPDGSCTIPIFDAKDVPPAFRDPHNDVWDNVRVRVDVSKGTNAVTILDTGTGLVEDDYFFMNQFTMSHGGAELQLDVQFGMITMEEDDTVYEHDAIASLHGESLWLRLDFRRTYALKSYNFDSFERFPHMSHAYIARILEIVFDNI